MAIEREERVRERQRLTYTDALTGLPNRARFSEVLSEQVAREHSVSAILLADLDNLKVVNDTFGHVAGDQLIELVATRIASVCQRRSKNRPRGGAKVGHFGARLRPPGGRSPSGGLNRARRFSEGLQPAFRARLWARR
ncbi:GGDEF domain-containing protein [Affinirhizobium pseudoryzae]|uniref:GGDEF domain-containing protein n=1 Tax=Allorhizobium pseudoryzae TaxID=379684 RepID=UPI00351E1B58